MRAFSTFFLLSLSLSVAALAFQVPKIIQDALIGRRLLHSPYQDIFVPSDFDFWQSIKDLGDKAITYKEKILGDAAAKYASAADEFNEFKKNMSQMITSAEAMSTILKEVPDLQERFGLELARVFENLTDEFSEPLPDDQTERYRQQAIMISRALDRIEDALVHVCKFGNIPEADVRTRFDDVKPHMNNALLVISNLVNNHPDLLETLLISAAIMVIPGIPMLQLILRFFGFGPLGPVKGSVAAAAQRFFFGGVVREGSWFSMLQSAGMRSGGLVTKVIRAIKCFFWGSC